MNNVLRLGLRLGYTIPAPLSPLLAGREPGVLLYHGVPRRSPEQSGKYHFDGAALERQVVHLQERFEFIHPEEVFLPRSIWRRKAVLLTFDDGLRNNATVAAPILARHRVPALFFVCGGHVGNDGVLWFSYLHALEHCFPPGSFTFRGERCDMSPAKRRTTVAWLRKCLLGLRPHPTAMVSAIRDELPPLESFVSETDRLDWYAGMTEEQIAEIGDNPLFVLGAHTVDHPMLTYCEPAEAARQMGDNKRFLERVSKKAVTAISYPSGDYDSAVVELSKRLGFGAGYAVVPLLGKFLSFEIPRSGVYQSAEEVAAFKAMWSRRRTHCG
jgi:peptidoglycan/xylan/chitin deacetylase (PgdA/CDA1 family)